MSEYTPNRAQIGQALECAYIESSELEEVIDNIQTMLSKVRAEAKAEALTEAGDALAAIDPGGDSTYWDGTYYQNVTDWLRDRAKQVKEGR